MIRESINRAVTDPFPAGMPRAKVCGEHHHADSDPASSDAPAAAAAAAKSLQSCPTLCYPINGSPPGSPVPGIFQARILEWVAISFSNA